MHRLSMPLCSVPTPEGVMDYRWLAWPDLVATVERAPGLLSPWAVAQEFKVLPLVTERVGWG